MKRVPLLLILLMASVWHACVAQPATPPEAPVLAIDGLGKGTAALDGPWQFHLGDNAAWSATTVNDAAGQGGWEQISADKPWGAQGHPSVTGYAWYRRHLHLSASPGVPAEFTLMIQKFEDVSEIYWNGVRIGGQGTFPPHPAYPFDAPAQVYRLGVVSDGVLAVRAWKAPLVSFDTGLQGGFQSPPLIGSPVAIANSKTALDYRWLHSRQYSFGLLSLYGLVVFISFLAWLRAPAQRLLLWMALYCICPLLSLFLVQLRLPWSHDVALGLLQPVNGLEDISLWFLLLWLLRLTENKTLVRVVVALSVINMSANVLDGALTMVDWSNPAIVGWAQAADGILTAVITLPELLPLVLVAFALRKGLDSARWLVAVFATLSVLIRQLRVAVSQGRRFTHWTFDQKITAPLFKVNGNSFDLITIATTCLLLAIIYAVYRYMQETLQRQGALERELHSAQELQQVLIPEALPSLVGYSVTSAYRPAEEVGGDFFQVIARKAQDATLVVLGDVSGKGLRAAMTVSLIVGTLRTLAEFTPQPAAMLEGLNRRLHGRLYGGFATCLVAMLHADGRCILASAGHPSPFLNQRELELPGTLPLGLLGDANYEEITLQLEPGDHLLMYTDGLLEARTAKGELFSFERLQALIAGQPSAEQALQAAQQFGQQDDITVLTLTRLAVGEEATLTLSAPVLANA